MTSRRIIVCADDAGWSNATDHVILNLAQQGCISAISVLAEGDNAHAWRDYDLPASCSLGLHFQLTWNEQTGSSGLGKLILQTGSGTLSQQWLRDSLQYQLEQFEVKTGRTPAFIDGHQHVHMLNQIRNVLIDCLAQRYGTEHQPAVRSPWSKQWRGIKPWIINSLGAGRLHRLLNNKRIPANTDFAGIYALNDNADYRALMQSWLNSISHGGLIMCHPGGKDITEHGTARTQEANYFASPAWRDDLKSSDVALTPFDRSSLREL